MLSLEYVKGAMLSLKPYLISKYNVSDLYIFGSYARGEQTDSSDIDILVDFNYTPDLLTFIEMEEFLSKKFKSLKVVSI